MLFRSTCDGVVDIYLSWKMTDYIIVELQKLQDDPEVDVVLVPFPVMTAIKKGGYVVGKARVIRVEDRVLKTIFIDKFCA